MKVEINHLTKVIQGNVVLDDINACFSCASGENGGRIYGIQGINGSGKTMLMIVQVAFVQMGADRTLKPIRKKPPCKFTANLVYLVGRGFTGAETLNDVVGQNSLIRGLLPQSFG